MHHTTPSRSPHNALHSPSSITNAHSFTSFKSQLSTHLYYWGERSEPHTCGVNGKLSVYIYIWYVRIPYICTSCPICARCNISTLHVGSCNHCCSRDKTSRTERLNSGNKRNRNLKTVRKGRHYYQDGG